MGSNIPRDIDYVGLHARYLAGESGMAIAADVGIQWSGLYRAWDRLGLARRSPKEAGRLLDHSHSRETIVRAQAARRGAKDPIEVREARARTREVRQLGISHHERAVAERLVSLGVAFRQQAAIGPYNVDFAFDDWAMALDIDGGGHNPRVNANRDTRTKFIVDRGWALHRVRTRRPNWLGEVLTLVALHRLAEDGDPI